MRSLHRALLLTAVCAACARVTAPAVRGPAPVAAASTTAPPTYADLVGTWHGVMNEGAPSAIHCDVQMVRLPSGEYVGRVAVPAQGAELRASAITADRDALRFEIKQVRGVFDGKVNAEKTVATGMWTQAGQSAPAPIVLRRMSGAVPETTAPKAAARRGVDGLPPTAAPFTMPLVVRVHGRPNVLRGHGASYLVYELEIVNAASRQATILALDVIAQERTLAHLAGAALEDVLAQTGCHGRR